MASICNKEAHAPHCRAFVESPTRVKKDAHFSARWLAHLITRRCLCLSCASLVNRQLQMSNDEQHCAPARPPACVGCLLSLPDFLFKGNAEQRRWGAAWGRTPVCRHFRSLCRGVLVKTSKGARARRAGGRVDGWQFLVDATLLVGRHKRGGRARHPPDLRLLTMVFVVLYMEVMEMSATDGS